MAIALVVIAFVHRRLKRWRHCLGSQTMHELLQLPFVLEIQFQMSVIFNFFKLANFLWQIILIWHDLNLTSFIAAYESHVADAQVSRLEQLLNFAVVTVDFVTAH